jgi:hypothetical protein
MTRKSFLVLVVAVLSLVGAAVVAQTRRDPTAPTTPPIVLSGQDVGVRVIGPTDKSGKIPGTLVVKIKGQWVDVVTSPMVVGASE